MPHIHKPFNKGAQVFEKETISPDNKVRLESIGITPGNGTINISVSDYINLLLAAGFEFKGIADGDSCCWLEQQGGELP